MRFRSLVPRRPRLRCWGVVTFVLAAATTAVAPGVAGAQQPCPEDSPTYLSNCGPTFVLPAWGDAGGWTDPSKYSTIQLGDINGDGNDELIARNDQGIEIYRFDTTLGQWRPQVDANDVQQVLTDFRSPLPSEKPATDWSKPEYYSTIGIGDIDLDGGEEVYGRFADGVHAYKYTPPTGTQIDGGTWQEVGGAGPFSDAIGGADPSIYGSLFTGAPTGVPALLGRRHPTSNNPASLGVNGILNGSWAMGGIVQQAEFNPDGNLDDAGLWNDAACGQPSCYLNIRYARVAAQLPDPGSGGASNLSPSGELLARTQFGVSAWTQDSQGQWIAIGGGSDPYEGLGLSNTPGPFADVAGPDCPFSSNGASGPGSADCLGTSPSYYETLRTADIDGRPGEELLARASDGLRVKRWNGGTNYDSLATLTALAGPASSVKGGLWGSIRTGDINGDHKDEVLALDGTGLQAWSYDPAANSWSKLPSATPLALADDPWLTHPEYYSTIRVGDVDGDGRDDVVARGQFGIRTWFYNRRGTGGWERYLPEGYPDFPGTPTSGQQAAFNQLTKTGHETAGVDGVPVIPKTANSVRDVWTPENAPAVSDLQTLQQGILSFAGCSGLNPGEPPSYQTCTPPQGSSGFDAGDWTAVINEVLAEIAAAETVLTHFNELKQEQEDVFISDAPKLPAISTDLQLAGAAGNTATYNLQGFFAGTTGIAASLAGLFPDVGPAASAGLWVASELISMLPSASPTATASPFQSSYAGLQDKFAEISDDTDVAWRSQSLQVRADQGLSTLVAELRGRGTWNPNWDGMESAARQGFTVWIYQTLVPTMYLRYGITNCTTSFMNYQCESIPSGKYVVSNNSNGPGATWIGPTPTQVLCPGREWPVCNYAGNPGTIPNSVADMMWGGNPCNYKPGDPDSAWTFGKCSLGVPMDTITADSWGWSFTTWTGSPVIATEGSSRAGVGATAGVVRASVTPAGSGARSARAGSTGRASRDVLGPLRFAGRVHLGRRLRLRRMRVVVERTLFEHGRREELARSRSGRRLRPFALRHARGGVFTSGRRGAPRVSLDLRRLRTPRGSARLDMRLTRVRTRDIRALCGVLPASVSLAGRPLELETRLRLRDRTVTTGVTLRQRWRCVRDRKGEFTGIRPVKPKPPAARPGLAVRMRAPRVLASGRRASVLVTVANRRRARPSRVVSSLWDLRITGSAGGVPRTVRVKELRARRSRTLRLIVPVPRRARGRVCMQVAATAASARGAGARRCARIAGAPPAAGCSAARTAACPPAANRRVLSRGVRRQLP